MPDARTYAMFFCIKSTSKLDYIYSLDVLAKAIIKTYKENEIYF